MGRDFLRLFIQNIGYPAILIAIFIYLLSIIIFIITKAKNSASFSRIITGALLPQIGLVFLLVIDPIDRSLVAKACYEFSWLEIFGFGAFVGLTIIEASRYLAKSDSEISPPIFCLFISSILAFFIFSFLHKDGLESINLSVLGSLIIGGLDIVLIGPPGLFAAEKNCKTKDVSINKHMK